MALPDEVVKGLFALGGGVVGATIGALIKGYFDSKNRDRRELTVWKTRPTTLVMTSSEIEPRIEILFDGQKTPTLSSIEFQIANTGNRAILDIAVTIDLKEDAKIIASDFRTSFVEPCAVDVSTNDTKSVIRIPYLNPSEHVVLLLLSTSKDPSPTVSFRQTDVAFRVRTQDLRELLNPAAARLMEEVQRNPILDIYMRAMFSPYRGYLKSQSVKSPLLALKSQDANNPMDRSGGSAAS